LKPYRNRILDSIDFMAISRRTVEKAIGEHLDGSPLADPNSGKDPAAVSRGHLGRLKGGEARVEKLSPTKRKQIAKKAAKSRWKS
jgi:hypothetical protein